jgi:hypothetical protein
MGRRHSDRPSAVCRKSSENWHGNDRNDDLFSCDYKAFVDGP